MRNAFVDGYFALTSHLALVSTVAMILALAVAMYRRLRWQYVCCFLGQGLELLFDKHIGVLTQSDLLWGMAMGISIVGTLGIMALAVHRKAAP